MNVTSKTPRVVPWTTWDEWQDVYYSLYSDDDSQKKIGIDRVCLITSIFCWLLTSF